MADNTFKNATNLGTFGAGKSKNVRFSGFLGKTDPIDTYKFTLSSGVAFQAKASYATRGGSFNLSFYVKNPLNNKLQNIYQQSIAPGKISTTLTIPPIASASGNTTVYVRLDRPTQNVNYRFSFAPLS